MPEHHGQRSPGAGAVVDADNRVYRYRSGRSGGLNTKTGYSQARRRRIKRAVFAPTLKAALTKIKAAFSCLVSTITLAGAGNVGGSWVDTGHRMRRL